MADFRKILIQKASGEEEEFSSEKLIQSLINAGADHQTARDISDEILNWIYNGISTKRIYDRAFKLLHKKQKSSAIRYSLKKAIYDLGPTGYPFEVLIGILFQRMGFNVETDVVLDGNCVTHEMDVVASNHSTMHLVECKFHKDQGKQVSVQVPLYVRSRVNDIINKQKEIAENREFTYTGWIVTNTHFSSDSIHYSSCNNLNLLAWNYPEGNGLKENIEKYKIYPITILKNLTLQNKQTLLNGGIVSCKQLFEKKDELESLGINKSKVNSLLKELNNILG